MWVSFFFCIFNSSVGLRIFIIKTWGEISYISYDRHNNFFFFFFIILGFMPTYLQRTDQEQKANPWEPLASPAHTRPQLLRLDWSSRVIWSCQSTGSTMAATDICSLARIKELSRSDFFFWKLGPKYGKYKSLKGPGVERLWHLVAVMPKIKNGGRKASMGRRSRPM